MEFMKILDGARFTQVGFVVNDIEETIKKYAIILDCVAPAAVPCGEYEITQTKVYGQPSPEANSVLAFFNLSEGVQLELIQPNEVPSVWRDHLNQYGEGIHHIAFTVDSIDDTIEKCLKMGMILEQEGNYGDGGGKYAYLNAQEDLKCRIELLENFK